MRYPLARNPVFWSVQGEGALIGEPMVFVRLAGCSVGCPLCDTDYRVDSRATAEEIAGRVDDVAGLARWVWITGGEPTDHDLRPLVSAIKGDGRKVALATSGVRKIHPDLHLDWLSVSPHDPGRWEQLAGDEVKIIPGLNGHRFEAFAPAVVNGGGFPRWYVVPCEGDPDSMAECLGVVRDHWGWKVGIQAHKHWGLA